MSRKQRIVKYQKLDDKASKTLYWDFATRHFRRDAHGNIIEPVNANPDSLSDNDQVENNSVQSEAIDKLRHALPQVLTEAQYRVYKLIVEEGKTKSEAARLLEVKHQTIDDSFQIIERKIKKYFSQFVDELQEREWNDNNEK